MAREGVVEARSGPEAGGVVVPLFRGSRGSTQPLVTLGNGLWKKADVMRRFAVSARTVERWQREQGLPAEKPFGAKGPVRYDQGKVEAWWTARCANGATG